MFGKRRKALEEEVAQLREQVCELKNEADSNSATFSITDTDSWNSLIEHIGDGAVTPKSAMTVSAVFACVRLIAGAVASSPVEVFRRDASGNNLPVKDHELSRVLRLKPANGFTAATFWKTLATEKILNGNGYAAIIRYRSGKVRALIPRRHNQVVPYWAWELGLDYRLGVERERLYYQVTWDDGTVSVLDQDDMIHIPNVGWDGKRGLSTVRSGAQAMGLALGAEKSARQLFTRGMVSEIALSYPAKMAEETQAALRDYIERKYTGAENHHTPLILTEGGEAKTISMNPEDAQLIESRQFSVIDICRFFGVPPIMIGESEKTSSWGSGVEQMARWFATFTMNDHFVAIEQELEAKLFRNSACFAKFNESELTRGDTKTRGDYYRIALGSLQQPAFMTVNEVRKQEGLPPIGGGDEILMPEQGQGGGEDAAFGEE